MKKIPDIINRLWNVCGQMEVGTLLTCGSGIIAIKFLWRFLLPSAHLSTYFGQRFVNPDNNLLGGF